jgi:hypothetical protein
MFYAIHIQESIALALQVSQTFKDIHKMHRILLVRGQKAPKFFDIHIRSPSACHMPITHNTCEM